MVVLDRRTGVPGNPAGPTKKGYDMRVMVLVKANEEIEAGRMPTADELSEMGKFNEELVKAGIMLAGDGLKPSSKGKRVRFEGTDPIVSA